MSPHPIISLRKVDAVISFLEESEGEDSAVQDARVRSADNATRMTFSRGAEDTISTREFMALSRANVALMAEDVLHS